MKPHLFMALAMIVLVANAWDLRLLQGWSDPNCAEWSSDGETCLKCIPRSYNNTQQNKCIRVDDNCKTWSETNGQCLTCYDSYGDAWKNGKAVNGKCPYYNGPQTQNMTSTENNTILENTTVSGGTFEYDVNCKCYTDAKVCIECYQDYELDSQGMCQVKKPTTISNCMTVTSGVCTECETGFYIDEQGTCTELPANCTKVDSNGNCTECAVGFVLTEMSACVQEIMNCTQYSSEGTCQLCDVGLYLNSQSTCSLLSINCLSADTEGKCTMCESGFTIDIEGGCQQIPENCNVTNVNGICTQCDQGFYLDMQMQCLTLPQNCTEASTNGECTACDVGLILSNGQCIVKAGPNPNCAQQNDMGECTKCRRFYELKNGDCVPTGKNPFCKPGSCECGTGKCLECRKGYFLDSNGICTAIGQNCKEYNKADGSCTSCQDGFQLSDGQCTPIKEPISAINLNCMEQDENGTCIKCRKYYKLIDGQCAPLNKNPKCQIWSKGKVCQCCYYPDKYYLDNNNICSEKNANCAQINMQNGQCTKCEKGYTLKDGQCTASTA